MHLRSRTLLLVDHMLSIFFLLLLSSLVGAQATFSAAGPLLHLVKTIYLSPSLDDLQPLVKARLGNWSAVGITLSEGEADAVLNCEIQSSIIAQKVVLRLTVAEVTLVDRPSRKVIWRTRKSTIYGMARLADDIVEQLKEDWRKSATGY